MDEVKKRFYLSQIKNQLLPNYWRLEFERDLPRLSKEKTEKIILYMCEYIYLGSEKNYFTDNNITDILRQLCNGIEKLEVFESETVFGEWIGVRGYGRLQINPNLENRFLKHVIFHELTHCVTPNLGIESYEVTQSIGKGSTFLREIIAESTACDLVDDYILRTPVSNNNLGISSDWLTVWNRSYQQLGDEFLQTISFINTKENNTDRKKFKALSRMAMDTTNQIAKKIYDEYVSNDLEHGAEYLQEISVFFSNLVNNHPTITKEMVDYLRKRMKQPITIYSRSDSQQNLSEISIINQSIEENQPKSYR